MREIPHETVKQMIADAVSEAGSQAEFARRIGVPSQSVWYAIQGVSPRQEILDAINIGRTKTTTVTYWRKTS